MPFRHVRSTDVAPGAGPHPAGSPFDRRISDRLGLTGFEVYQVELPAGAETVPHDHVDDRVEDMYAFIAGAGWLIVNAELIAVSAGEFVAVSQSETRFVRAGAAGLTLIAVCGSPAADRI